MKESTSTCQDQSSLRTRAESQFISSRRPFQDFRQHFLGVHFFNPPRYLHLVEIIRPNGPPEVSCFMFGFDQRLGKGVVPAKDRPNFIANRIGTFGALYTINTMLDDGYSIEEVDKITGPAIGRRRAPRLELSISSVSTSLRTSSGNLTKHFLTTKSAMFVAPGVLIKMVERSMLGTRPRRLLPKERARATREI